MELNEFIRSGNISTEVSAPSFLAWRLYSAREERDLVAILAFAPLLSSFVSAYAETQRFWHLASW